MLCLHLMCKQPAKQKQVYQVLMGQKESHQCQQLLAHMSSCSGYQPQTYFCLMQKVGLLRSKGSCSQPCVLFNTICCCCCVANGCQQDRPDIHVACHSCAAFAQLPDFQGEMITFASAPARQTANDAYTVQALLILCVVCLAWYHDIPDNQCCWDQPQALL